MIKYFSILVFIICYSDIILSQNVYIDFTNETQSTYNLVDIQKVTFSNDVMNLHFKNGTIYSWNVSTLGLVSYDSTNVIGVEELLKMEKNIDFFPNPTNGLINANFQVLKDEKIDIEWLNIGGELLKKIYSGIKNRGEYTIKIDLSEFNSGVYFFRYRTNSRIITEKIIITK
jgi:hypothetical protein